MILNVGGPVVSLDTVGVLPNEGEADSSGMFSVAIVGIIVATVGGKVSWTIGVGILVGKVVKNGGSDEGLLLNEGLDVVGWLTK